MPPPNQQRDLPINRSYRVGRLWFKMEGAWQENWQTLKSLFVLTFFLPHASLNYSCRIDLKHLHLLAASNIYQSYLAAFISSHPMVDSKYLQQTASLV